MDFQGGLEVSADDLADHLDQLGRIERLDQPASGPSGAASLLHLVARLDGQDQDRRGPESRVLAQLLGQADAVHARHVLVGQHEVDGVKSPTLCLLPSILAIHGFDDMEASVLEGERHHLAHRSGIVDGEDCMHIASPGNPQTHPAFEYGATVQSLSHPVKSQLMLFWPGNRKIE